MVAAVHSCIVRVYGDCVIRLPTVIRQYRFDVQYAPDDCYTHKHTHNLRVQTTKDELILQSFGGVFLINLFLESRVDFSANSLPQTKLK